MMKKVVYSPICKLIAFVLCIASICAAVWILFSSHIYILGERDCSKTYQMMEYRTSAARLVISELEAAVEGNTLSQEYFHKELKDKYQVEYYASYGTTEVTNSMNHYEAYYANKKVHMITMYINDELTTVGSPMNWRQLASSLGEYMLYLSVNDDYIAARQQEWDVMQDELDKDINLILVYLGIFIVCFLYLAWTTGHSGEDNEIHLVLIDRVYTEIRLAVMVIIGVLWCAFIIAVTEELDLNIEPNIIKLLSFGTGIAGAIILALVLSVIRSLKDKTFLKKSLIWRFLRWMKRVWLWFWKGIKRICGGLKRNIVRMFAKNFSGRKLVALILIYTIALCFSILLTALMPPFGILLFFALIIGACIFAVKRSDGFVHLKNGLHMVRMGNLNTKIMDCPEGVLHDMAEDINEISDGLSKAVDEQVRAERMKSELITNVSHDLKTPLTSIINYADLLTQQVLSPDEANDYAAIIKQKGERLKKLTSDLFDVSKAQSGNEVVQSERLDAVLLLKQALAEQNDAIEQSKLTFVTEYPDREIFIMADGKKLSRVFENLIGNILKYSLDNTRVYIQIRAEGNTVIEFKNIANYPMNFDNNEIMERFVRGDLSRSTEGSGLGLAIARSYVQICGGKMNVVTDGDLFKAVITFPPVIREHE